MCKGCLKIALPAAALALFLIAASSAQESPEYKIGQGDVLEISFWQDEALNAQVKVGLDGKITLDIAGQIDAAGYTTAGLQTRIVNQISRFNSRISQCVVRVLEFNYQHIFVIGQVNTPGKHAFEEIPDLWTIINEAGGVTEIGDLSRVTIIRGGADAGRVEVVNVADAISSGNLANLPRIRRQDTIELPRTAAGLPSGEIGQQIERKNLIYAIGAVNSPGAVQFEENLDVLEAIAMAGGTTASANLKKISVITKDGYYGQTMKFNLKDYAESGRPARYILQKEDAIIIPERSGGFLGVGLGTIGTGVGILSSVILLYLQLRPEDNPPATNITVQQ